MRFNPVTKESLPPKQSRESAETAVLVREFLASGQEVAEVTDIGERKPESVRSTLGNYVQRHPELGVGVFSRGGKLFIATLASGLIEPRAPRSSANGSENSADVETADA